MLHDDWCERLASAFDAPEIMAVTGLVLPLELESEAQRLFEFHWGFGRGYHRIDFDPEFFEKHRNAGCPAWTVGPAPAWRSGEPPSPRWGFSTNGWTREPPGAAVTRRSGTACWRKAGHAATNPPLFPSTGIGAAWRLCGAR